MLHRAPIVGRRVTVRGFRHGPAMIAARRAKKQS
jgi:hypothetical protein